MNDPLALPASYDEVYDSNGLLRAPFRDGSNHHSGDSETRQTFSDRAVGGRYSADPQLPPLEDPPWPSMDAAAFRGLPGKVVQTISPHTEADPVALLLTFLATFGAVVGRGPHVRVRATQHPGRLFTVIVGDTAKARKGTSWDEIKRVFQRAAPEFMESRIVSGFGSGEAVVDALAEGDDHRLLVREGSGPRFSP